MDGIKVGMKEGALMANPNCSTIFALVALIVAHNHAVLDKPNMHGKQHMFYKTIIQNV